jgi:hypothetical protein
MGTITRSLANNITTSGVILPAGITNASVSAVTSFANASAGTLILLSTQTASASATISFTTGLDSTYDEYQFHFINMHPATDSVFFTFQFDTGTNTNYNQTITSTHFRAAHNESDSTANLSYATDQDQAQGTAFQSLSYNVGNGNDECISGVLELYNPSSSTYVKHFIARANVYYEGDYSMDSFTAGYVNTTTAITRVQFKMSSGNIDDGIIKMYGVKKS